MIILYSIILILFSIYSYNLLDPNITLFNGKLWEDFRNVAVYWGYYRREVTSVAYIIFVVAFFLFHLYFLKHHKRFNPLKLALVAGIILLFSYPFLSHDFLNYLFDAKIVTFYHQNPYTHKPLDFAGDPWLRFMHWTHRTYPYGPVFLILSIIPSFLSFGKFILSYFLFKFMFIGFYGAAVYVLNKISRRQAILFATSPLILIEGLNSLHNDLIGVALALVGIDYLIRKKNISGRVMLILSAGIKYLTAPLLVFSVHNRKMNIIPFFSVLALLAYLSFRYEIQPWYFITLFAFLPHNEKFIEKTSIFCLGLVLCYYPYIRLGGWDTPEKVAYKHTIIIVFSVVNLVIIFVYKLFNRKNKNEVQSTIRGF